MSEQLFRTHAGERIAIVSGIRTPFAKQCSELREMMALELGTLVVNELLMRTGIDRDWVDLVVFGQVIQMPQAPNIAREIVLNAGLNPATDAYSVTRACTTSMQTLICAAQEIACGHHEVAIAGGADSSSILPVGLSRRLADALIRSTKQKRFADKLRAFRCVRPRDLLPVPPPVAEFSTGLSMGQTAEQMAKTFQISREVQDDFAWESHQRAAKAWQLELLSNEVMTVYPKPYRTSLVHDNPVREKTPRSSYAELKPVFDQDFGTVTAANSSVLTDGAAAMLLMREQRAKALGLPVLGYLRAFAGSAIPVHKNMLMGPSYAVPVALRRAGLSLSDIALIDIHEAFAAQVLANLKALDCHQFARELGLPSPVGAVEPSKLNVLGGSIAYGHPFAATGARMITQQLHELRRRGGEFGLVTACAAGGLGCAIVLEAAYE
ncbi:acetyl-CoA C-acyltransferase FadI [Vibrio quintilis]|uniref:3-ketoacyl-CoA thiolase n=1 Tax=Vibrio quintilis TaxID=1117707 RepID=A0A1M7YZ26_9VIBR|nr:acetyl-CoA C-acyltransferase FadI [Vibrio quintilis]SHO57802.1 3-ketoacyl-CoA thiolase [Vibrio quintilis]